MMRSKLSWLLILIALGLAPSGVSAQANGNQLQNPTPSPSKSSKPPQEQSATSAQQADPNQRQPNTPPIIVNVLPPQKTQDESDREVKAQEEKASSDRWMTIFNGLLAAFTLVLVAIGAWQGWQNKKSADAARDAAIAAISQVDSIKTSERAYVKMSHLPPGIVFRDTGVYVHLNVQNFGHTPARVTDVVVAIHSLPQTSDLPVKPDYSGLGRAPSQAFLVPGDAFNLPRNKHFDDLITAKIKAGAERLVVLGYIDYIDQFTSRHRAGYAREYRFHMDIRSPNTTEEAFSQRSNLALITQHGYNYDRQRNIGEGNDWIWTEPPPDLPPTT
jgi:hypothetical protein